MKFVIVALDGLIASLVAIDKYITTLADDSIDTKWLKDIAVIL